MGWRVLDNCSVSEHKFNVDTEMVREEPVRNPRKTHWVSFKKIVNKKLTSNKRSCLNAISLNREVELILKVLVDAYLEACPLSRKGKMQNPP